MIDRLRALEQKLASGMGSTESRMLWFIVKWAKASTHPIFGSLLRRLLNSLTEYWGAMVVPIDKSVDSDTRILPFEVASSLIRSAEIASVIPCYCRNEFRRCDAPRDTCIILGSREQVQAIDELTEVTSGSRVVPQKALEVLEKANRHGLVHHLIYFSYPPGKNAYVICSCCDCCCVIMAMCNRYGINISRKSGFVAVADAIKCNACGTCMKRCKFGARFWLNGKASVNEERCHGCGLCVTTCTSKATRLQRHPTEELHRYAMQVLQKT